MRGAVRKADVLSTCLLLFCGAVGAQEFSSQTERRSPAHPRVILAHRQSPTAALRIIFHTGAADDARLPGVTRFAQHMLLTSNGRVSYDRLWHEVYAAGGTLRVETTLREAIFEWVAPRETFDAVALHLLEQTFNPKLDPKGIERARSLTLADEMVSGDVEDLVSFLASRILLEGTRAGGDYNSPRFGDADVVKQITFDEVRAHIKTQFAPANATVVVAGDFDQMRLGAALARWRGGSARAFERPDVEAALPVQAERSSHRELHLHAQVLQLKTPRDVAAAMMLSELLHDRVLWTLRKHGVAYATSVFPVIREWADLLVIVVPVHGATQVVVEAKLQKILQAVAQGQFEGDEFERTRIGLVASMQQADMNPPLLARNLSFAPGRLPWWSAETAREVQRISQAEFLAAVRPWMRPERSANILFGRGRAKLETR